MNLVRGKGHSLSVGLSWDGFVFFRSVIICHEEMLAPVCMCFTRTNNKKACHLLDIVEATEHLHVQKDIFVF